LRTQNFCITSSIAILFWKFYSKHLCLF
jgi:hypothetical protein